MQFPVQSNLFAVRNNVHSFAIIYILGFISFTNLAHFSSFISTLRFQFKLHLMSMASSTTIVYHLAQCLKLRGLKGVLTAVRLLFADCRKRRPRTVIGDAKELRTTEISNQV